jgi:hypothetical protein
MVFVLVVVVVVVVGHFRSTVLFSGHVLELTGNRVDNVDDPRRSSWSMGWQSIRQKAYLRIQTKEN